MVGGRQRALLLASGAVAIAFAFVQPAADAQALQREKALAAAERIGVFIAGIEEPMRWLLSDALLVGADAESLRIEFARLLRRQPALTELVWIDERGRERAAAARLGLDAVDSGTDRSQGSALSRRTECGSFIGAVDFRRESEPYLPLALASPRSGQVLAADVNLNSVRNIVSEVGYGHTGPAYVVDAMHGCPTPRDGSGASALSASLDASGPWRGMGVANDRRVIRPQFSLAVERLPVERLR